jgi:hypothetical protein
MKKSMLIVSGVLLLVLLLLGAAFVAGRLLSGRVGAGGDAEMVTFDTAEGRAGFARQLEMINAPEMPVAPPDVAGVFVRREDNSLFVGTGNLTFVINGDGENTTQAKASYDGPVVEVVVTHDTQIYRDDTFGELSSETPSGAVQQVLNAGSVEEIAENGSVAAWGERRGERLFASVLVYYPPVIVRSR